MQTTAGSLAIYGSHVPGDAVIIQQLRAAGAVILGKANLGEWAPQRPCRNQAPSYQTNIGVPNGILAGNDSKPNSRPGSPWSMPAGAEAPSDASPVFRAWLEHERPEPET
jgi:hypothetical protein